MDFNPRFGDVRRMSEQAVLDHINDRTESRKYPAQKLRRLESLLEVPDHVLACQALFQGFIFPEKDGFSVTCYLARDSKPFYGVMVAKTIPKGKDECIMMIAPSDRHMPEWLTEVQFLPEGKYKDLGIETRCGAVLSEHGLLQLFFCRREAVECTSDSSSDRYSTTTSYKLSTSADLQALVQELRPLRRFWRLHAEQCAAWNKVEHKHFPSSPTDTPKQKRRASQAKVKWWDTRGRKAVTAGMAAPYVPLVAPIETHHSALLAWFVRLGALFPASHGFVYSFFQYSVGEDQPDEKARTRYKCVRIGRKQENGRVAAVMTAILMSRCYYTQKMRPLDLITQQQVWCTEAEVLCQTGRPAYLATIEPASGELTVYEIPDPLGPFIPVERRFLTSCNTSSSSERLHTRLYLKEIFKKITRDRVRFVEPEVEPVGKRERYAAKLKSLVTLS
ncbi:hypothetical protein BO86DRAFT_404203 [Aspergillus japonicus CBS 114.51]|uniref:Uncharacterized protein n=1 Tax=Aspergillus japonicus CBS 114.51 TaxID=1448312 RepID=A0A8T8WM89_ASPJA|nr:hypothetical protein BO86DRAFT_404203 [Aspergillus japonicus CBS 114.51]RAH76965.1 hypothetical protein BO86DRAFT_404203 [Aspergillus japonicus CBS 114.51]